MKKTYVKPQVYFEDFQLSASIAGNCNPDQKVGHSENNCVLDLGDTIVIFVGKDLGPCAYDGDKEGYCYQSVEGQFFAS